MKKQETIDELIAKEMPEDCVAVTPLVSSCNFWRRLETDGSIKMVILKEDAEVALSNGWCELL